MIIRRDNCVTRPLVPLPLERNIAYVSIFTTDRSVTDCNAMRSMLSTEENVQADRFMFERDRIRYIASHAGLRVRLAACCETSPETLVFSAGSRGKPFLSNASIPIEFNLSHSGVQAAIVIALERQCGVDIEKVRAEVSHETIATRFFCEREQAWLQSLPQENRSQGFFRLWSTKEAILKASGNGLSTPLDAVDTTDVLEGISPHVSVEDVEKRNLSLWVCELDAPAGYAAALAIEGTAPALINM
jgi:4'-phosphopantetheinyl transferase